MNCLKCLPFAICELVNDEKKVMTKWGELWQPNLIWEKAAKYCEHYGEVKDGKYSELTSTEGNGWKQLQLPLDCSLPKTKGSD